jgi:thiamine kinase
MKSEQTALLLETFKQDLLSGRVNERLWQLLPGSGQLNRTYAGKQEVQGLIVSQKRSCVMPGVSFAREIKVLKAIREYPWAPRLLAADSEAGLQLFPRYAAILDNLPLSTTPATLLNSFIPAFPSTILELLADLQSIRSVPALDYQNLQLDYAERLAPYPQAISLLRDLAELVARLPADRQCLVHHDLHPGNLLVTSLSCGKRSIKLIDWEYAGLGNPWLDMAAACCHWSLVVTDCTSLPAAAGMSRQDVITALATATQVNDLLARLWYWLLSLKE